MSLLKVLIGILILIGVFSLIWWNAGPVIAITSAIAVFIAIQLIRVGFLRT